MRPSAGHSCIVPLLALFSVFSALDRHPTVAGNLSLRLLKP